MDAARRLRQTTWLLVGVAATLAVGTVGFRLILDETWFQAFYRAVITATHWIPLPAPPRNETAHAAMSEVAPASPR